MCAKPPVSPPFAGGDRIRRETSVTAADQPRSDDVMDCRLYVFSRTCRTADNPIGYHNNNNARARARANRRGVSARCISAPGNNDDNCRRPRRYQRVCERGCGCRDRRRDQCTCGIVVKRTLI